MRAHSFPSIVLRAFLLCALFAQLVVSAHGLLHFPGWSPAIEEQVPVDAAFEEDEVQYEDEGVVLDVGIRGCAA
jgi:hypothetical protein